jgi:radical SAM/Cys-rich protein
MTEKMVKEPRRGVAGEPALSFPAALEEQGITLTRDRASTLQVNVGLLCNQACRHCHLEAGPRRREIMSRGTMDDVIAYARRGRFSCIDVTGGAPEMVPGLDHLLQGLSRLTPRLMLRSNLTAVSESGKEALLDLCGDLQVSLVASFPSTSRSQADAQRGTGFWSQSLSALKELNERGYGRPGTGLELSLVVNPAGAFLPPDQCQVEKRFRSDLKRRWGIDFTSIFSFANVPLGRYRRWLIASGNYGRYMKKLADSFNPETVSGLMCRSLVSLSWDGHLFDCDFNQAAGLPLGGIMNHVADQAGPPAEGDLIAVGDHCYACTAGSGFT